MRRWAFVFVILIFLVPALLLCRTALDPEDFSGQWYASTDQSAYLFQDGLIYSNKHQIPLSGDRSISGAYAYCRDSVVLFAEGVAEQETRLYLVHSGDSSLLCENRDGTGKVYFIRYHQ